MLAVRPLEGYTTMGRETFLAKVIWENGWPVVLWDVRWDCTPWPTPKAGKGRPASGVFPISRCKGEDRFLSQT